MKLKNIAAICKKTKMMILFNEQNGDGEITAQYISNGAAVYPITGLPVLGEDEILTIFDITEKQRDKWYVRTQEVPAGINLADIDKNERQVEQSNISIASDGKVLLPLQTYDRIVFIDNAYIQPFNDVMDIVELYARTTVDGAVYIAAKAGFMLQAVIFPVDIIKEQFVGALQEITRKCTDQLYWKNRKAEQKQEEPEQYALSIDQETGEII